MLEHINQEGTYDEKGRRLDKVPLPPPEAIAATTPLAGAQEVYLTAVPVKATGYAASDSKYVLRATWTEPRVAAYEYVYLYNHVPPNVGEDAGTDYYTWARTNYDGGGGVQEASYFFGSGPQTSLERLSDYWAAYVRYDAGTYKVVARTQFRSEKPNWMANVLQEKPSWGSLRLDNIFLPASHDSGTFDMVDRGLPNVYNQTQTMTFVRQLQAGVRWLDIRMGYYSKWETGSEGPFFTVHADYASWSAWSTALKNIVSWLGNTPTEIIFINFKWEGNEPWTIDLRTRVLQMTYDELKKFGVLPSANRTTTTVNDMVKNAQRIVLSANDSYSTLKNLSPGGNPICPGIDYDWFNKYYVDELIKALDGSLGKARSWMWAAGTVITPHKYDGTIPWGVYSLTVDGIDRLNRWVRVNATQLNVVPVDFVETSVALALVEELNKARA